MKRGREKKGDGDGDGNVVINRVTERDTEREKNRGREREREEGGDPQMQGRMHCSYLRDEEIALFLLLFRKMLRTCENFVDG